MEINFKMVCILSSNEFRKFRKKLGMPFEISKPGKRMKFEVGKNAKIWPIYAKYKLSFQNQSEFIFVHRISYLQTLYVKEFTL